MNTNDKSGDSKGFVMDIYCNFLVKSVQDTFGVLDNATKKTLKKNFTQAFANAGSDEKSITKTFNDLNRTINNLNKKFYNSKTDRTEKSSINKFIEMLGVNRKEEKATSKILKKNYLEAAKEIKNKREYIQAEKERKEKKSEINFLKDEIREIKKDRKENKRIEKKYLKDAKKREDAINYNFSNSRLGRAGYYIQQILRGFNIISRSNSEKLNSKNIFTRYLRDIDYVDENGNVTTKKEISLEKIMTDFQNSVQLIVQRFQTLSAYTNELSEKSKKYTNVYDKIFSSYNNQIMRDPAAKANEREALRLAIDVVGASEFIGKDVDTLLKNSDNMYQNAFARGTFSDGSKIRKMVDVLGIQRFKTSESNYLELMDTLTTGMVEKYDKNGKSYFEKISEENMNRLREQILETVFNNDNEAFMKAEMFHKDKYSKNGLYGAVSLNNQNRNIGSVNSAGFLEGNKNFLNAQLFENKKNFGKIEELINNYSGIIDLYNARIKGTEIIGEGERTIIDKLEIIIENQNKFNKIDNVMTKYKVMSSSHPILSSVGSTAVQGVANYAIGAGLKNLFGKVAIGSAIKSALPYIGSAIGATVGWPAVAIAAGGALAVYTGYKIVQRYNNKNEENNNQSNLYLKNIDKNLEENNDKTVRNVNPNIYTWR